jgi:hypothetical protein
MLVEPLNFSSRVAELIEIPGADKRRKEQQQVKAPYTPHEDVSAHTHDEIMKALGGVLVRTVASPHGSQHRTRSRCWARCKKSWTSTGSNCH